MTGTNKMKKILLNRLPPTLGTPAKTKHEWPEAPRARGEKYNGNLNDTCLQIFVERLPLFHPDTVVGYPALLQVGVDYAHFQAVFFGQKGSLR